MSDDAVISRPPSLPIATTAARPPGNRPCSCSNFRCHFTQQRRNKPLCNQRVGGARFRRRYTAEPTPARRPENACSLPITRAVSRISCIGSSGNFGSRRCELTAPAEHRASSALMSDSSNRGSSTASNSRRRFDRIRASRGARSHDAGDQLHQRRIGFQQREQLHAGRQLSQKAYRNWQSRRRDQRYRPTPQSTAAELRSSARAPALIAPPACGRDAIRAQSPTLALVANSQAAPILRASADRRSRLQTPYCCRPASARARFRTARRSAAQRSPARAPDQSIALRRLISGKTRNAFQPVRIVQAYRAFARLRSSAGDARGGARNA